MIRILSFLILAACAPLSVPDRAILAVGDSILAWNGDRAIPQVVGRELARPVTNAAVPGARFANGSRIAARLGFDVRRQYRGDGWEWVIVDGGGNDLRADCGCGDCGAALDALIGPDATGGTIPTFVAQVLGDGSRVVLAGYYDPSVRGGPFAGCAATFDTMNRRLASLAARSRDVIFVDTGQVIDPTDLSLYATDLIHPSPTGSALIGRQIARAIEAAG